MKQHPGELTWSNLIKLLSPEVWDMSMTYFTVKTGSCILDSSVWKKTCFSLIHLRLNGPVNSPVNVGTWDSSWYINHLGINWSSRATPQSTCGEQCSPGYIRVVKDDCKCCWSCVPCHYNQIVTDEHTCTDCLRGYWPNEDYTKCEFQWRRTLFDCTLAVFAVVFVFSFMVLWVV